MPINGPVPNTSYQDQLSQLFGAIAKPGQWLAPDDNAQANAPVASPPTVPMNAVPGAQAQPAQAPTPKPSDDPEINLPEPPNVNAGPLAQSLQNINDIKGKIAAVPPVDYNATKPHWYDRLLGFGAGVAGGYGSAERGAETARGVTFRREINAENQRQRALSPLFQQLDVERQNLPFVEAASRVPQQDFDNRMRVARERREQVAVGNKQQYQNDLNEIRQNIANGKFDEAKAKLAEQSEKNKNDLEYKNQLLDLREKMLQMQAEKARQSGGLSANQSAMIENRKATALQRAETAHRNRLQLLDPKDEQGRKESLSQLLQDKQAAQDNYENEIMAGGGSATHLDVTGQGATASTSTPTPTPSQPPKATPQTTPAAKSAPQAQAAAAPKVGEVKTLKDGRRVKITSVDVKNRKITYEDVK